MDETATNHQDNRQLTTLLTLAVVFLLTGIIVVYYFAASNEGSPTIKGSPTPSQIAQNVTPTAPPFPPENFTEEDFFQFYFAPADHEVTISDNGFSPVVIEAKTGEDLRIINEGTISQVLSIFGNDQELTPGSEYSVVLSKSGNYTFVLSGFSNLEGAINVN